MQWQWSWQLCLNEYVLGKKICLIDSPGNTSTIAPGTDTVENIPVQASLIASLWTGRFWHMKRQLNLFSLYGWEQGMCWVPIKTGIRFVLFFKAFFFFFFLSFSAMESLNWDIGFSKGVIQPESVSQSCKKI